MDADAAVGAIVRPGTVHYSVCGLVPMKSRSLLRSFLDALAVLCLVGGTIFLGLGLSVFGYIDEEHRRGHLAPGSAVRECVTLLALGVMLCLGGIVLRGFFKKPSG